MNCTSFKRNTNKVCIGDLNRRIEIQTSYISPDNSPNSVATATFTTIATVWAMIKTNPTNSFIDGVNTIGGFNTDFYIRYSSSIDFEQQLWVLYDGNRFKITGINNIDKQDNIVNLRSTEAGSASITVNSR
jgi:SPP1 family predicted phage head-tail adaptor